MIGIEFDLIWEKLGLNFFGLGFFKFFLKISKKNINFNLKIKI